MACPRSFCLSVVLIFTLVLSACTQKTETKASGPPHFKEKVAHTRKAAPVQAPVLNHRLNVVLRPEAHEVLATDTLTIPANMAKDGLKFALNADLEIVKTGGAPEFKLIESDIAAGDIGMDRDNEGDNTPVRLNIYELNGFASNREAKISFNISGQINYPVQEAGTEYARGFSSTPGLIEKRGVYLSGASYWVPSIDKTLVTYDMQVVSPKDWSSVSQGRLQEENTAPDRHVDRWVVETPTEEIYVIAAQFTRTEKQIGKVKAMAYLRTPDPALADKYLNVTGQYMDMYSELIGPFPYSKFALVENFWETGYGMPSFTLLGSQIIRFPFILHSSYPHELLHNWWGNSVYIDFESGNWAEGLTAYMADHLIAEQGGKGAEHRRAILQRYTSYVDASNDFPLRKFTGRTDGPTEAIGYGKTAMVFDMLRSQVGDAAFIEALQTFYRDNKFKTAGWAEIQSAFEKASGETLDNFFAQWIDGMGAPELEIEKAGREGDRLTLILKQTQDRAAFTLQIPVALYYQDHVETQTLHMSQRQQIFQLALSKDKLIRVEVDPRFNVFRRLHWAEIPPSLGAAFGAEKIVIVLPTRTKPALISRYAELAGLWAGRENISIVKDSDLSTLPKDGAVWVFGRDNRFYSIIKYGLNDLPVTMQANTLTLTGQHIDLSKASTILAVRNPENPEAVIVGLTAHSDQAVAGLARKLPHYGKYSYLAFEGDAPTNIAKGQWPATNSPLIAVLDKTTHSKAKLTPRKALAERKTGFDPTPMMHTVKTLSAPSYQGRGAGSQGLDKAADYITEAFKQAGLKPGGTNASYLQSFTMQGPDGKPIIAKNIIGIIPGKNPKLKDQLLVISAHYDHLGYGWPDVRQASRGHLHPGADDNASGVAVLLELARQLAKTSPDRTLVFLAPAGEEAGLLGAKHYVKTALADKTHPIYADVNLDTVGRAGKELLVFGADSAREWPFIFMGIKATTGIGSQLVKHQINASDHTAFLAAGIPAIHIFGAATRDYHRPSDTADKIDPDSLIKVTLVTKEVVDYLATRPDPLTVQIEGQSSRQTGAMQKNKTTGQSRKVSTGVLPDFAFSGTGVKITSLAPESAAALAGLKAGDVIVAFGGVDIRDLKTYSEALKAYRPGDKVKITVLRAGKAHHFELILKAR